MLVLGAPSMCGHRCSRRYQEVSSTRSTLVRPYQPRCNNSNKLHLSKTLERGTIDQRRTWEYGGRGKGVMMYRDTYRHHRHHLVVVVRCDTRTAQGMRQYPHRLSAEWLGICASLFTSERQSPRWRGSDEAIREATSPTRAAQKRHGQPLMCVGATPRGRVSHLMQLLHDRVVCDPKETRLARDKHRAAPYVPSRTEQQEQERGEEG